MDGSIGDELNFREIGNLILNRTIALSRAVNSELLEPISQWLDDPDFMGKFEIIFESDTPNWAVYKQRHRKLAAMEKALAGERLKRYWREIQQKRRFQKEISLLFGNAQNRFCTNAKPPFVDADSLSAIIAPFSPVERYRAETAMEFSAVIDISIFNLLPWTVLITSELLREGQTSLDDMRPFLPENPKFDKIAKFQHLLQMATDGQIQLEQSEPNGNIRVTPCAVSSNTQITIKDQSGGVYIFDWQALNDAQQEKIIADAIEKSVICTC